jgi:uroporphyrinogen-III synthase
MLLVRAAAARDTLPESLTAAGATLTIAEAYRNVIPEGSIAELQALFSKNPPDAITFTSASTAQNLAALLDAGSLTIPPRTVLASIGPITSQAMRDLGLTPTIEATESTIPALAKVLETYFHKTSTP